MNLGEPWELKFATENMDAIIVYFRNIKNSYAQARLYPNSDDRNSGKVTIPFDLLPEKGTYKVWLFGENTYGRLKISEQFVVR